MKLRPVQFSHLIWCFLFIAWGCREADKENLQFHSSSPQHGEVLVGESFTVTYTLKNHSDLTIRLGEFRFSHGSAFRGLPGTCGTNGMILSPGDQCTTSINFTPLEAKKYTDSFWVEIAPTSSEHGAGKEARMDLSGIGMKRLLTTPLLSLVDPHKPLTLTGPTSVGTVAVGSAKTVTLTLTNEGHEKVKLDSLIFHGPSIWSQQGGSCLEKGIFLTSGHSCTLEIKFSPDQEGSSQETLNVGYYLGDSGIWAEFTINLRGQGTDQMIVPGRLHVDGRFLKDDAGNTVILRGVNVPDPRQLNNKRRIRPGITALKLVEKAVLDYHAQVIRLPIQPDGDKWLSTIERREKYFQDHVDPVVKYLTNLGIYVILDFHLVSDYAGLWPKVAEFWNFFAPKFKDNPYVLYEILSDPINPDDWNTWVTEIARPAVELIREHAPHNLIVVGGPARCSHMNGAAQNPVPGENILYSAHIFPDQSPEMWQRNFGAVMEKFPLFVTAWGYENGLHTKEKDRGTTTAHGIPFSEWLNANQLSWTAWVFDFEWGPRMFDKNWNLLGGENGLGVLVRDLLFQSPHRNFRTQTLVQNGADFRYWDQATFPGTKWMKNEFDDSLWKTIHTPLEYGHEEERPYTYYFRRSFDLSRAQEIRSLNLETQIKEGMVIFFNGVEIFRSHWPQGMMGKAVGKRQDSRIEVNPELLVNGQNILAVEIHHTLWPSTKRSFDLKMKGLSLMPTLSR